MNVFTDIHCHSVMTHYRNPELNRSACEEIHSIGISESLRSSNTQSDFGKLVKGNIGSIIISLYPIERKFLLPKTNLPVIKEEFISRITGFSINEVKRLINEGEQGEIKYYDDLKGEYNYLISQVNKECKGKQVKITRNYSDYKQNAEVGNTISIVLSIEGAHALSSIAPDDLVKKPEWIQLEDYITKFRTHVYDMKSWGPNQDGTHTPLFITLAHHFWNMLVGHAESLPFIFDQKTGKESGFTDAGREMIEDLLSSDDLSGNKNKTRRVLIDVKHMSPLARKQYYYHLRKIKNNKGLNIPVICSHASMGDAPALNCFIKGTSEEQEYEVSDNFFNTSSLSLIDEDIVTIINSDGLIGIVLHEGRIAHKKAFGNKGYKIKQLRKKITKAGDDIKDMQAELLTDISENRKKILLKRIEKKHQEILTTIQKMREGYIDMLMANVYKVVEVYAKYNPDDPAKGWDHVCIGSDFDGMMNKLDSLGTAEEFPVIHAELIKYLSTPRELVGFDKKWKSAHLKKLHFNQSPETLVNKFMSDNTNQFLRKYFTEDYLINDNNPN